MTAPITHLEDYRSARITALSAPRNITAAQDGERVWVQIEQDNIAVSTRLTPAQAVTVAFALLAAAEGARQ
jgi:hypothetical protein